MKLSTIFKRKVSGFTITESLAALVVLSLGIVLLFNAFSYVKINNFSDRTNAIYTTLDSAFYTIKTTSDIQFLENIEHISISTVDYKHSNDLIQLTVIINHTQPVISLSKLIGK